MHLSYINILILICLSLVSRPRVHPQEDGCSYRYGKFTRIDISSITDGNLKMFDIDKETCIFYIKTQLC